MSVRDQPRWGRNVLDLLVTPQFAELTRVAHQEYRAIMLSWRRDARVRSVEHDDMRFERLQQIVEHRLKRVLAGRNRRMMFNTIRGLTQDELRRFAGNAEVVSRRSERGGGLRWPSTPR